MDWLRLPWTKPKIETRSEGYTDSLVAAMVALAAGDVPQDKVAALEIASGLWQRGFASAKVSPFNMATATLTPGVLGHIGRWLHSKGELVLELRTDGVRPRLDSAGAWSITGGPDRDTWEYDITVSGPSESVTRSLPAQRVMHLQYAYSPTEPWRGISPLDASATTKTLLTRLEEKLGQEAGAAVGSVIPVPSVDNSGQLQSDLRSMRGEVTLVESTASGWGGGTQAAPSGDYQPRRLGPNPPQSLETLRDSTAREILSASGVPASLLGQSDGTLAREDFRRFLHSTLTPVAAIILPVLRDGLDTPDLDLNFDGLYAADLSGRARSFSSMVQAGMPLDRAAALAGLITVEE